MLRIIEERFGMEEHRTESGKAHEVGDKATSVIPLEASDNVVLRKLLRGRRYFDPPNIFWRTCYKCGDEGHTAGNCTLVRLRKPCYKCGRRNHNVKRCTKRKDCLICKKGGHRAKDCPEKYPGPQDAKSCLRCGDSGHDMFSCINSYSADDLKHIQCYICRKLGHLCCVECTDSGPAEASCYRCGQLGHTGLACFTFKERPRTSCYKCGEEGHFAQKCPSSPEVGERNSELVTPKKRCFEENNPELTPLPNDCNDSHANEDFDDRGSKSASDHTGWHAPDSNSNHKGAWTTNDHVTSNGGEYKVNGWASPETIGISVSAHSRTSILQKDSQQTHSFLSNHPSTLSSNRCDRSCRRRDTKIYLGISNDNRPKWLIEIFIRGIRTTIEGSPLLCSDNGNPDAVDAPTSFSLASVGEAIFTTLLLTKDLCFHSVYIITDGLFSQVWYRNFHKFNCSEDWKVVLQQSNMKNCNIFWLPTSVGCFLNLKDIVISSFNSV